MGNVLKLEYRGEQYLKVSSLIIDLLENKDKFELDYFIEQLKEIENGKM